MCFNTFSVILLVLKLKKKIYTYTGLAKVKVISKWTCNVTMESLEIDWSSLRLSTFSVGRSIFMIFRPLGYGRVYLPLCKVADTPFHIQGHDLLILVLLNCLLLFFIHLKLTLLTQISASNDEKILLFMKRDTSQLISFHKIIHQ